MRIWLALLGVAACGSESPMMIDAPPYDIERCLIKGHYGALGAQTGRAGMMGGITMTVDLEVGPRDTFFLKMVTGKGVFAGGVAPGTYTIAGADAGYTTCGLCVHIIADLDPVTGPSKFYFADAGMVTVSTTTAPIMGSGQNLKFAEINISTGAKVAGGCEGSIDSITFTTM